MITALCFYFFSNVLILSSLMVISVQNSIYSVLFLVMCFVAAAIILCLLECEFIALIFIILYVGAIAVLFLFVVMMLDLKLTDATKDAFKYFPVGGIVGIVFLIEISAVILNFFKINPYQASALANYYSNWFDIIDLFSELEAIGQILFTSYVSQFLIAGVILLLAVLCSVVLNMYTTKHDTKAQITFRQLSRSYREVLLYKN